MLGVILGLGAFVVATLYPNLFAIIVLGIVAFTLAPQVRDRWANRK